MSLQKEQPQEQEETKQGNENAPADAPHEAQDAPKNDFMSDPGIIAYIEKQVAEGIKKALRGEPPKADATDPAEREQKKFDRMTYGERLNLFRSDPQAYQKLSKGVK